ncbi:MAG: Hsp20/alpha crystallin family protein [Myxococcaceae bacterium]|nr:Hsp20/alpha crystallin family protein [Myxococcaceae bacterium]
MLARWDRFDRDFENLLRSFGFQADVAGPFLGRSPRDGEKLTAPADIVETAAGYQVKVDLPGVDPKGLNVQLDKDVLTISAERRAETRTEKDNVLRMERVHGTFARSFVLPHNVDASKIEAAFEHGVLTVTLPKKEEEKPRTIDIKVN